MTRLQYPLISLFQMSSSRW